MSQCPVCGIAIEPKRFMCWKDWERVPLGLQKTIWLLKRGDGRAPFPGLDEAVASAVEQARDARELNRVAIETLRRTYAPDDHAPVDQNGIARRDALTRTDG
jgi:hypothetical protein